MSWFRNAKFQNKFFLAFGMLLSFAVVLSIFAVIVINNVAASFTEIAEGPNKRLAYLSDTLADLANCRRCILAMSYSSEDTGYINISYESFEASADLIVYYLDANYNNYLNDAFFPASEKNIRMSTIADIKEMLSEYRQNVTGLYHAALAGDKQRADELLTACLPLGDKMTSTLKSLHLAGQNYLRMITEKTRTDARRAISFLIIFAVFLIILSFAVSIFMASALKAPIIKIERAMSEIVKGNLSFPIRSDAKDELGILSNHIGDMVDTISMLNKAVVIADNVCELIFVTDFEYNLIYINRKSNELYGIDKDACIGRKCYETLHGLLKPCDICPLPDLLRQKEDFPTYSWERHVKISGHEMWFACNMSVIQWVDGSLVQICTCRDDTLNKQHGDELRKAAAIAEEASRAKSTFLANLSHEIRTPMNAVMGMNELILRKELPQDVYEHALGIKTASQNLLSIVNDILDLAKIESGTAEVAESVSPKVSKVLTLPAHSLTIANIPDNICADKLSARSSDISFSAPGAKVLIVDDIHANLVVAEGLMAPYLMQISVCSGGREAIKLITSNKYDLVFMDHMMPEMDGLKATGYIRAMEGEYFASLPIIALTANAVSGVREMFIQNGMNDFLAKPIEMPKLNAILEKWIPKEKQQKAIFPEQQDSDRSFIDLLKSVSGLSVEKSLSVMGGSLKTYEEIFRFSVGLLPDNIAKLNNLLETNIENYAIEIHGVKGVLNNIGAYELGETAFELEKLSKSGEIDSCNAIHSVFISKLANFLDEVDILIDNSDVSEKSEGDKLSILPELPKIKEAAEYYDATLALDILEEICRFTYGQEADKTLEELIRAFERFDFDNAFSLLEKLNENLTSEKQTVNI